MSGVDVFTGDQIWVSEPGQPLKLAFEYNLPEPTNPPYPPDYTDQVWLFRPNQGMMLGWEYVPPPEAISTLDFLIDGLEVTLSWEGNSGDVVEIQRKVYGTSDWETLTDNHTGALSYTDSTTEPNTLYRYRVLPSNDTGPAPDWSNIVTVPVIAGEWVLVDDNITPEAVEYTDTGLSPKSLYEYYIVAESEAGDSDPSNIVWSKTLSQPEPGSGKISVIRRAARSGQGFGLGYD